MSRANLPSPRRTASPAVSNHELGLFKATPILPCRANNGRFVKVVQSPERKLALINAQLMRAQMGLPADPRLVVR